MALVQKFSPLGNLKDLTTPAQLDAWNLEVEHLMSKAVAAVERSTGRGKSQFVDPSRFDMGAANAVPISWKGFPISLVAQGFTQIEAFKIADGLMRDNTGATGRDVQDEYLEWYVHRDTAGDIVQIDFTTEGPEYWTTLVDELKHPGVLKLYGDYYSDAKPTDIFPGGHYNPDNAFNNERGAMHLRQINNNLWAEVAIAALSTLTYTNGGVVIQSGADLCREAGLGGPDRASDPNIAETVNGAAQAGSRISLIDPIGLYLRKPDFRGWTTPDGSPASALWKDVRGNPVTRGTLKAPANFKLSDVKIAGQNIAYGGQVAKLIDVQLTGLVSAPGAIAPTVVSVESLGQKSAKLSEFSLVLGKGPLRFSRTGR